ncbi:hypothetical protein PRIPAC_85957, partial [Pristionchus pacificus]
LFSSPSRYSLALQIRSYVSILCFFFVGFVSSDEASTMSSNEKEDQIKKPTPTNDDKSTEEEDTGPHIPCSPVVNGREKCLEIGFQDSACGIPVITESDVNCPSSSNPTIFLLPGNGNERFLPAKFMICMVGGKWMISGRDGGFMGDEGLSSPIHVVCFPEIKQEEQPDPFDELDDDELEEKFGDKNEKDNEKEKEKTEL